MTDSSSTTATRWIARLGPLRIGLATLIALETVMAPFALAEMTVTGWGLFVGAVIPALSVITVFVVLLDMLMSRVFMAEQTIEKRVHYREVFRFEVGLLALLLVVWVPVIAHRLGYLAW